MTKSNPLFIDSTKRSTDSIGCCVELKGLTSSSDESVYIKIKSNNANDESTLMKQISPDFYQAKVWLQHQQEVILQFYVMNQKGIVKASKEYPLKATYVIDCHWVEQTETVEASNDANNLNEKPKPYLTTELIMQDFKQLSCLIDKWGL